MAEFRLVHGARHRGLALSHRGWLMVDIGCRHAMLAAAPGATVAALPAVAGHQHR